MNYEFACACKMTMFQVGQLILNFILAAFTACLNLRHAWGRQIALQPKDTLPKNLRQVEHRSWHNQDIEPVLCCINNALVQPTVLLAISS